MHIMVNKPLLLHLVSCLCYYKTTLSLSS